MSRLSPLLGCKTAALPTRDSPGIAMCPLPAGHRPPKTRKRDDLPLPLGPVTRNEPKEDIALRVSAPNTSHGFTPKWTQSELRLARALKCSQTTGSRGK